MGKPIVYVDMEGTILCSLYKLDYYELMDRKLISDAKERKTITAQLSYLKRYSKTVPSDPNLMCIPRPGLKKSLSRLVKHADIILLSGASESCIREYLKILDLNIFSAAHSVYNCANMLRPNDDNFWLLDDNYNIEKLNTIKPGADVNHLIQVVPYYGTHDDHFLDHSISKLIDKLPITAT